MKAMAISDLIIMRKALTQMAAIGVVVWIIMAATIGSAIAASAAIAVMVPYLYSVSIVSYDEMGKWEAFRLCMPLSRSDVVKGRYASTAVVLAGGFAAAAALSLALDAALGLATDAGVLFFADYERATPGEVLGAAALGTAVACWMPAFSMPLMMRYGLTRATRFIPLVVAVVALAAFNTAENLDFSAIALPAWLDGMLTTGEGFALIVAAIVAASALALAVSMLAALRLYARREF